MDMVETNEKKNSSFHKSGEGKALIVDSLFPVTCPHGNFRAACKFIIEFDSHVT